MTKKVTKVLLVLALAFGAAAGPSAFACGDKPPPGIGGGTR